MSSVTDPTPPPSPSGFVTVPDGTTGPLAESPPLRLEWRDPAELAENPANWRRHPEEQLAALSDVIAEVGWAGVCLFNEVTGRLVDGHARRKVALEQGCKKVPVLVGRWSEEQERKILATLDPLAGMAEKDQAAMDKLLAEIDTESGAVAALLESLASKPEVEEASEADEKGDKEEIPEQYQILLDFDTEEEQAKWLEQLTAEGVKCRSLIS